jgi:DNA invertase Pin-like site-specific DNA recombinase
MNKKGLRYLLYARKSSESEDRQMASIPDQIKEVSRIAKELGLHIIDTISESKSAKAPGRSGFEEMLSRIRKGEADAIICWKLNRLARNPVDGGQISWMLQQDIIKHIQCYGRDYKPSDNVLMMQVEFGMANQYVKDLSVDVKRGTRLKAERGWNPSNRLPIGYHHNQERNNNESSDEIIPDKNFQILSELWRMMLTGKYSVADIKRIGDEKGLVGRTGKYFALNTYHLTFSSRFYCGYFKWKDADGILKEYPGKHKPMITPKEFEKVQRILGQRSNDTRLRQYDFPFKGILTCGACGCSVCPERKCHVYCSTCKKKFSCIKTNRCPGCETSIDDMNNPKIFNRVYYRCTRKKKDCSQRYITEEQLKREYLKAMRNITIPDGFEEMFVHEIKAFQEKIKTTENKRLGVLNQQLSKLSSRLKKLALMRADGELEAKEYQESKEASLEDIQRLETQIASIQDSFCDMDDLEEYSDFGNYASGIFKTNDIPIIKGVLSKLGSNHVLIDGKVEFIRAKPLLAIEKLRKKFFRNKTALEPQKAL